MYYKDNGLYIQINTYIYLLQSPTFLPQCCTFSCITKPDDLLLSGCGKDEREGKNNALAGSIATFQSRQLASSELCTIKTMALYIQINTYLYLF